MTMSRRNWVWAASLLMFAMLTAMLSAGAALAAPLGQGAPDGATVVYGTVTMDGAPAPAGTQVSVLIDGLSVGTAKTGENSQPSSGYRIDIQAYSSFSNKTATVLVAGTNPASAPTFSFQLSTAKKVDLAVSTQVPTPTPIPPTAVPPTPVLPTPTPTSTAAPQPTGTATAVPAKKGCGDANSDGTVDSKDLAVFTGAYGAKSGGATFVARADFNRDGVIDVKDLAIMGANYGKGC